MSVVPFLLRKEAQQLTEVTCLEEAEWPHPPGDVSRARYPSAYTRTCIYLYLHPSTCTCTPPAIPAPLHLYLHPSAYTSIPPPVPVSLRLYLHPSPYTRNLHMPIPAPLHPYRNCLYLYQHFHQDPLGLRP